MKLTTGYDFQGYFITEYLDVIFDEMLVGLGFGKAFTASLDNLLSAFSGSEATEIIEKLNEVKQQLRNRVIKRAAAIGANALIGIDFESSRLGDLIMVSMTATAVKIEKIASPLPSLQVDDREKAAEALVARQATGRRKKIEAILTNTDQFDAESFVNSLTELDSSEEMFSFVVNAAGKYTDLFDEDILTELRKIARMEKMYGIGSGKKDFLNTVATYLGK